MRFFYFFLLLFGIIFGLPSVGNSATLNVPSQYSTIQAAINSANLGDTIIIQAGLTYPERLVLKNKTSGSGFITIQSSALSSLPSSIDRVNPSYAQYMPYITAPSGFDPDPIITTEPTETGPAHHYKLVGLRIGFEGTPNPNFEVDIYEAIRLGQSCRTNGTYCPNPQNTAAEIPHDFVIDRCWIHGSASGKVKNGIALDSRDTTVINSYISEIHTPRNFESHGIVGVNGSGNYEIINNYVEAAGINIFFGGGDPVVPNQVPTNILVKRNYCKKLTNWFQPYTDLDDPNNPEGFVDYNQWRAKNLIELKNAKNVVIEDNIFDTAWGLDIGGNSDQRGQGVLFTVRNQDGAAPWSTVEDVDFRYNIVRNVAAGVQILGQDDSLNHTSENIKNLNIHDNLFGMVPLSHDGRTGLGDCFMLSGRPNSPGVANLTINHNTCVTESSSGDSQRFLRSEENGFATGFILNNNIAASLNGNANTHVLKSTSSSLVLYGSNALAAINLGSYTFNKNVLTFSLNYSTQVDYYTNSPFSYYENGPGAIGFISPSTSNFQPAGFRLSESSAYHLAGTDGKDIGVDTVELSSRTACTESGLWSNCGESAEVQSPYPGPTPPSVPVTIQVENFDKGGQGIAYNDTYGNTGSGAYRSNPTETVDIGANMNALNGYVVREAGAGEWLEYTVNFSSSGQYYFGVQFASGYLEPISYGKFQLEVCNPTSNGGVSECVPSYVTTIRSTGGWGQFKIVKVPLYVPTSGTKVLRLIMVENAEGDNNCHCVVADFDAIMINTDYTDAGYEADIDGDTGDGAVLANDITILRSFVVGTAAPDPLFNEFQRADTASNSTLGDGLLLANDVTVSRWYELGQVPFEFAGGPTQQSSRGVNSRSISLPEIAKGERYRQVRVASRVTPNGCQVSVPIDAQLQGDERGIAFTLEFDPAKLANPQIVLDSNLPTGTVLTTNLLQVTNGRVGILIDSDQDLGVSLLSSRLLSITFDVVGGAASGPTEIQLTGSLTPLSLSDSDGDLALASFGDGKIQISPAVGCASN